MDNKSFERLISCGICFEMYDQSSKRPRVLACGHSFCHSCLKIILQWHTNACCANCKDKILFASVQSIPINFSMESMIGLRLDKDRQPNCYTKIKIQIDQWIDNEMKIMRESLENLNTQKIELHRKLNSLKQLQTVVKNSQSDTEISNVMNRINRLLHKGKKPIGDSLSIVSLGNLCREKSVYAVDERGDAMDERGDAMDERGDAMDERGDAVGERDGTVLDGKLDVRGGRIDDVHSFQSENPPCMLKRLLLIVWKVIWFFWLSMECGKIIHGLIGFLFNWRMNRHHLISNLESS